MGRPLARHMCTDMCITSLHNRSGLTCASVRFLPFRWALVAICPTCLTLIGPSELAPTSAFRSDRRSAAIVERAKSYKDELLRLCKDNRDRARPLCEPL